MIPIKSNDYELLYYIRQGQDEALKLLLEKYISMIEGIAHRVHRYYYFKTASIEDLIQVGIIALNDAIDNYCEDKNRAFSGYAHMCIECDIRSLMKSYLTHKQKSLMSSYSLDQEFKDDQSISFQDMFSENKTYCQPQKSLLVKEELSMVIEYSKNVLSPFEKEVFSLKLEGYDYIEIAKILGKNNKSVDNALVRIKKKMGEYH